MTISSKTCEACNNIIKEQYGTGRFCNKACACRYSTLLRRQEIGQKISNSLKGHPNWTVTKDKWTAKRAEAHANRLQDYYTSAKWDDIGMKVRRARIAEEQSYSCLMCGLSKWREAVMRLQLDHIDGDTDNNSRENLRLLCPNCHSQTDTWCKQKRFRG